MPELHSPEQEFRPAVTGHGGTPWAYRKPHDYAHDVAGKAREAEVTARLAAVRAKLRGEPPPPPVAVPSPAITLRDDRKPAGRCEDCGYLTTAPGHLTECGDLA